MVELPNGQIYFHYKIENWIFFNIPIKEKCNVFDGHDKDLVNSRLFAFLNDQRLHKRRPDFLIGMDDYAFVGGIPFYFLYFFREIIIVQVSKYVLTYILHPTNFE